MGNCQQCLIKKFNSFCALQPDELIHLTEQKTEKAFKKGQVIIKEGTLLHGVYCVRNGICKLSKLNSNGKEQIVRFIKDGDVLGYRSVISNEPVSLTITALEDMNACYIPKKELFDLLENNPKFTFDLLKTACTDLKDANMHISSMGQKNARQRLAETILFLKDTFNSDKDGYISILLTREEISSIVGTATESAIRLLSEFKKDGVIALKGKSIKILNFEKLKQISEGL